MKKLLIILIIVVLIAAGAIVSVQIFLPYKIKSLTENFVQEKLHKDIEISKVELNILKGVIFHDTSLYETGSPTPYIKIGKLCAVPLYPSLLTGEKIISALTVEDVYFYLSRDKEGRFNIPDIKSDSNKKQPAVLIQNISLKNLNLNFEDKKENFQKAFSNISLHVNLNLPKIDFSLQWPQKAAIKGTYSLITKDIDADINMSNINLSEFSPYLKAADLKSANLQKGSLHIDGSETYFIKGNIEIKDIFALKDTMEYHAANLIFNPDITITKEKLFSIGNIEIKTASFLKDKMAFKGDLNLNPQITLSKDNFSYSLEGNLRKAEAANIPYVDTLSDINAEFNLDKDKLVILSMEAKLKENPLFAQGELNYTDDPLLSLDIKTNTTLVHFIHAVKEIKPLSLEYQGKGNINLTCNLKGNLKQKNITYHVDYQIINGALKDFDNITAKGSLKNNELSLQEGSFSYKKNPFKINGELKDFTSPQIKLNLSSDTLSLIAEAKSHKDNIEVDKLTLAGGQTELIGYANIGIKGDPVITLEGYGTVELAEATKQISAFGLNYPILNTLSPQGELSVKFNLTGNPKLNDWEIKLAGAGENIKVYNLIITSPKIDLYKNKNELTVSPLFINLGEGEAELRAKLDFPSNKKIINLIINNIDLALIREQLKLDNKKLAGKLSIEAYIENNDLADWDKMAGEGKVVIKDGNIWDLELLKGLGEFLHINEFDQITFKDGSSDLFFKEENIVFENIALISQLLTLKGNGLISVQKPNPIAFTIFPEFNPLLIAKSEALNVLLSEFIGKTVLEVGIGGTLKKPELRKNPVSFNPLNGIKNILEEIIK